MDAHQVKPHSTKEMETKRKKAKAGLGGLHVVVDPPQQDGIFDIVFVHGLKGHCWETWTHRDGRKDDGVYWPVDLLPTHIKTARIMTFQYDSKVVFNTSKASLQDTADMLLERIHDKRESLKKEDGTPSDRPVVFVVHSLGGIVVKKALFRANDVHNKTWHDIGDATKGIVFFGTPHRGSDVANTLGPLANITSSGWGWAKSKFLPLLKTHSAPLREVSDEFRHVAPRYMLVSFYEENIHPALRDLVVDKSSSRMGIPHEQTMMMGGDHTSMCKFEQDDARFETVWRAIKSATHAPPGHNKFHTVPADSIQQSVFCHPT
ncbi:protein SERAC1 [Podospora fimiseda]|uniref:Protein SERAC1 n=1 Tax=Podospora fimiseda TaxID=252190 RepID=A0AAN6YTL4_9PEZI|nr:protein SERAC1 [Podospora fimiseda]